jgi:hypothetical protein
VPAVTPPNTRRDALLLGAVVLVVYALTLYPDLAGGDSGELTAAVATGGVIHPPGYPLYALLGKLFLLVPHGSVAWRMNFMSAACDAAAAGVLCAAVSRWSRSRAGGIVAGALFAASPGIWRYAVCAEVFALDNLLVATIVLLSVLYAEKRDARLLWAGALASGLALSDHQTSLFTIVPFAAWALWTARAELRAPKVPAGVVVGVLAGLLPYLYLPIAAAHHAPVTWGDETTWHGFWDHVLRREYGTFQLAPTGIAGSSDGGRTLSAWSSDLFENLGVWGLPLAAAGAIAMVRKDEHRLAYASIGAVVMGVGVMALLGNLPVTDLLHRGIVARFWQQPLVHVCAWCGFGIAWLEEAVGPTRRWVPFAAAFVLGVTPPMLRWHAMDRHGSTLVRSYGTEILRAAPPGALLVTKGDLITSPIRYLQAVEHARPDVRLVDQELMGLPWYVTLVRGQHPEITIPGDRYMYGAPDGFTMRQMLDDNVDESPVLVCGGIKPPDRTADGAYGMWPFGLCDRVHKGSDPVSVDDWIAQSDVALPRIDFSNQPRPPGSWEAIVWSDTWAVRDSRAAHLLNVAGADPTRHRFIEIAADMLRQLVADNPDEPPAVWKTYATALGRAGLDTPDEKARAADAWEHYLADAPADDPMVPAIRKEVERLKR